MYLGHFFEYEYFLSWGSVDYSLPEKEMVILYHELLNNEFPNFLNKDS